jgi:hypothetical protein
MPNSIAHLPQVAACRERGRDDPRASRSGFHFVTSSAHIDGLNDALAGKECSVNEPNVGKRMDNHSPLSRRDVLTLAALGLAAGAPRMAFAAAPSGQLTWGIHVSLTPSLFDPAET